MVITLVPARTSRDFEAVTLRSRAAKAPNLATTHLFRAMAGGEEMGLVVLDLRPGARCPMLYELFLVSARRNRGIGSLTLAAIEAFVAASGGRRIEVWPRSLDLRSRSDRELAQWYRRHGYTAPASGSDRLVKTLAAD